MSRLSSSFCILFLTIQLSHFVLPAPTGNMPLTASDGLVTFRMSIDREFEQLLPELELKLLQAQHREEDLEVLRMQLLQLNLLKLLVGLDCFILLCLCYYAREEKYRPVETV
ncbi:uncharacterized protein LOC26526850 [Drosophila erecta]|uniref:uncharacterized protein LOC26526850 n=1 Tax=Drosophila erecta TaxID=7220 RepID=UPI000732997C|nr:uncharacterized protein LOC26526850 [Drosophila erecta]KQS52172.1 uncharacterized protein Dere_GG27026 [Drosophila erecta]